LIVRLSALGDVVHVLPALGALRDRFPAARFWWITEELSAPLLCGHPYLEGVYVLPRKSWERRLKKPASMVRVVREALSFFRVLRSMRFSLALDFQGNLRGALVSRLSGAPITCGFNKQDTLEASHLLHRMHALPAPPRCHRVERNLQIPRSLGYKGLDPGPVLPDFKKNGSQEAFLCGLKRPVIACHPWVSAFGAFKAWTEEGFARFAASAVRAFGGSVIFTWAPSEKEAAERIVSSAGQGVFLAPKCESIGRLAALLQGVDLLVAPDTGVLHIADALRVPVVALFGPKDPAVYGPRYAPRRIVRSSVSCSPCTKRSCDHRTCMISITPEMVLEAASELLGTTHGRS